MKKLKINSVSSRFARTIALFVTVIILLTIGLYIRQTVLAQNLQLNTNTGSSVAASPYTEIITRQALITQQIQDNMQNLYLQNHNPAIVPLGKMTAQAHTITLRASAISQYASDQATQQKAAQLAIQATATALQAQALAQQLVNPAAPSPTIAPSANPAATPGITCVPDPTCAAAKKGIQICQLRCSR